MDLENKPELKNFYCPEHDEEPSDFEFADRDTSARHSFFRCTHTRGDGEQCPGLYKLYYLMQYTIMRQDERASEPESRGKWYQNRGKGK